MDERDPQTYAIIGAAMEVHGQLGHGFLEAVYHEALAHELRLVGVPFVQEIELPVYYKGELLGTRYRADLICFGEVVVELKAIRTLTSVDVAQLLNYLKATGKRRGLLLNFGSPRLEYERKVFGP
ncbi:MAG TPA: GxxExxY protein [Flavobacteriales bacterium]|nr:GxxExxY protein [Flavobacteriales bacterium]